VLIVDDETLTLDLYTRFLTLEGYAVVSVERAADAVTSVRSRPPDAILLDLRMPLTDGVECLRQIRHVEPRPIPVAMVTGDYSLNEFQLAAINGLGARLVYKPLWLDDIRALVRALLYPPK
jgi:DNA-binding response OmpR family regulator